MNRKPCVAVLGTGSIGARHLSVLKRMQGVQAIAVPMRPSRVEEFRAGGYEAATSLEGAVGATHCIVATDTSRHLQDGLAAAALGLHLLVEKPLARDAQEAARLYRDVTAAGRKVFVACVMRFARSLGHFRERLRDIGSLHAVRIECQSYLPDWRPARPFRDSYSARADEGGVLRDLIHEIDYAGWLYGWPETLQARVTNHKRLGIEAEEAAELLWEARDGVEISLRVDYLSKPTRRRMTAFGQRGTLEWDAIQNAVIFWPDKAEPIRKEFPQVKDDLLDAQTRAFLDATAGLEAGVLASGLDGVRALAVCDAARRASENRREEKVAYP
jgi:predicted dehydrogenase